MTLRGKGRRPAEDHNRGIIKVRPSAEQRLQLEAAARLAGMPDDGRAGGPALGRWLLELGLNEAERLAELKRLQRRAKRARQ